MSTHPSLSKRVLVADGERHIVRLIQANLERRGHHVETVDDGRHVMDRLRAEPFDVAILDTVLSDGDGLELLREIRGDENLRELSVALLTTQANLYEAGVELDPRPDAVIGKPFSPAQLVAAVEA